MEWMVELDIPPGQHMHPAFRGRLSVMAKWLAEMAEEYEASARWGARKLPPRSRWADRLYQLLHDRPEMNLHGMGVPVGWSSDPFWSRHLR